MYNCSVWKNGGNQWRLNMNPAKKITTHSQGAVFADIFIKEIEEETGCSREFLEQSRPSITRLFDDVTGEELKTCLEQVKTLIRQQAETEKIAARTLEAANKLEKSNQRIFQNMLNTKKQISQIKKELQFTNVALFGSFSGRHIVYKA